MKIFNDDLPRVASSIPARADYKLTLHYKSGVPSKWRTRITKTGGDHGLFSIRDHAPGQSAKNISFWVEGWQ